MAILRNSAQCRVCGDEVESKRPTETVSCSCGEVTVSGGHKIMKHSAKNPDNLIDTSVTDDADVEDEWERHA